MISITFIYCRVDLHQNVLDFQNENIKNNTAYNTVFYYREHFFTIVGFLTIVRSILYIAKFFAVLWFCRAASIILHERMILAITRARMVFFDNHFAGNILNRFSYDLNNIDEYIPFQFPSLANVCTFRLYFLCYHVILGDFSCDRIYNSNNNSELDIPNTSISFTERNGSYQNCCYAGCKKSQALGSVK